MNPEYIPDFPYQTAQAICPNTGPHMDLVVSGLLLLIYVAFNFGFIEPMVREKLRSASKDLYVAYFISHFLAMIFAVYIIAVNWK